MRHGDRQNSEHLSSTRFLFYSYHSFTWVTTPTVIIHKEILCFRDVSSDQLETSLRICQILPRSFKFNLHKASRKRSIQTNVIMCLRRKIPEASAPLTYFRNQKFDHQCLISRVDRLHKEQTKGRIAFKHEGPQSGFQILSKSSLYLLVLFLRKHDVKGGQYQKMYNEYSTDGIYGTHVKVAKHQRSIHLYFIKLTFTLRYKTAGKYSENKVKERERKEEGQGERERERERERGSELKRVSY